MDDDAKAKSSHVDTNGRRTVGGRNLYVGGRPSEHEDHNPQHTIARCEKSASDFRKLVAIHRCSLEKTIPNQRLMTNCGSILGDIS